MLLLFRRYCHHARYITEGERRWCSSIHHRHRHYVVRHCSSARQQTTLVRLRHCQTPSIQQGHIIPWFNPKIKIKKFPKTFETMVLKAQPPHFLFFLFWFAGCDRTRARNRNAKAQLSRNRRNTKKGEERANSAGRGGEAGRHSLGFHRSSSFNPLCSFIHELNSLHNSP